MAKQGDFALISHIGKSFNISKLYVIIPNKV